MSARIAYLSPEEPTTPPRSRRRTTFSEQSSRNASFAIQRSLRAALHTVADALTAHGFAAHADRRQDRLRIINDHCPFGDVAIEHPVICAVDRGMVRGMLSELCDAEIGDIVTESSRAAGDTFCTTAF